MSADHSTHFSKTTRFFHWLIAIAFIAMAAVGFYMAEKEAYALYPIHKSIGAILLPIVLLRVIWRLKNGLPAVANAKPISALQNILAKLVHGGLLLVTILFPVSGVMMSYYGGRGLDIFGVQILAKSLEKTADGKIVPLNADIAHFTHEMHETLLVVFVALLALHILAVIKHHVMDKDGTLKRMMGKAI